MLSDGDLEKTTKLPIPSRRRKRLDPVGICRATDDPFHHHRHQECRLDSQPCGRDCQPGEDPRGQRRRAKLQRDREAPRRRRPAAHASPFAPVTAKYFPRHLQADAASSDAGMGAGIDPASLGIKIGAASDRLRNCRVGPAPGRACQPVRGEGRIYSGARPLPVRDALLFRRATSSQNRT